MLWMKKEKHDKYPSALHQVIYPRRKRVWDKFKKFLNQYFVELVLVVLFIVGWLSGRGIG